MPLSLSIEATTVPLRLAILLTLNIGINMQVGLFTVQMSIEKVNEVCIRNGKCVLLTVTCGVNRAVGPMYMTSA